VGVNRGRGQHETALAFADSLASLDDPHWSAIGHHGAAQTLARLGQLRESERRDLRAVTDADRARETLTASGVVMDLAQREILFLNRPEAAIGRIEAMLAQRPLDSLRPGNRPYGRLVGLYAMAGRVDRAAALQSEYERVVPELLRQADPWAAYGLGQLALARGDGSGALAHFRKSRDLWWCRTCTALEEGLALERAGQPDSALAAYERQATLGTPMWEEPFKDFSLPLVYQRLGELYESRDKGKSLEYYGKLTALWKNADPELQPRIQEIKRRMATLAAEPRP
jgi:tetratricopeptide (TPR) repeat protein